MFERAVSIFHQVPSFTSITVSVESMPSQQPTILIRSAAPVGEIASAARGIFHDLAPDVPVNFSTFAEEMGGWLADRRFLLFLVGIFAAAALTLAAVGIYGVVAFSVARRTQEIGIRMALGAQRSDVLRLIVGEGARLAVLGVCYRHCRILRHHASIIQSTFRS